MFTPNFGKRRLAGRSVTERNFGTHRGSIRKSDAIANAQEGNKLLFWLDVITYAQGMVQ